MNTDPDPKHWSVEWTPTRVGATKETSAAGRLSSIK